MGYYHTYGGYFKTSGMSDADIKEAEALLDCCWYENPFEGEFNGTVDISGYNKYYDDSVDAFLEFITPFTTSGEITCVGDDDSQWGYFYDPQKKVWEERNGLTFYPSKDEVVRCLPKEACLLILDLLDQIDECDCDADYLGVVHLIREKLDVPGFSNT